MKYIDAEKLKAEIRKLRSESCISESDDYYEYAKSEIINIIDSLQQEQPEVDWEQPEVDWEEAAKKYAWRKEQPLEDGERLSYCFNPRIEAFKAGAEWMIEKLLLG